MMTSNRISPIQRGTSRPLGKSTKNTTRETCPRKLTRLRGKSRAGEASASATRELYDRVVPDITRKKAASSASQSSDLRQKMRKLTAHQIAAVIAKKMVSRAAYSLTEKP